MDASITAHLNPRGPVKKVVFFLTLRRRHAAVILLTSLTDSQKISATPKNKIKIAVFARTDKMVRGGRPPR